MLECGGVEIGEHQQLRCREAVGVASQRRCDSALADLALGPLYIRGRGAAYDDLVALGEEIVAREVLDRSPLKQHDDLEHDLGLAHELILG